MDLYKYLAKNSSGLKKEWFILTMNTYPKKAEKYLSGNKDEFSNPVGVTLNKETSRLFDMLIGAISDSGMPESIENIVRIRAVQDFSPSQAVGFLFSLKKIIRERLSGEKSINRSELLTFESKIDDAACIAFDHFMAMREKLYEIKANDQRRRFGKMVDRLNKEVGLKTNLN